MTSDANNIITIMHHDTENRKYVTGYVSPGSYLVHIDYYGVTEAHLKAVQMQSLYCDQYAKIECFAVSEGLINDFWITTDGTLIPWQSSGEGCRCKMEKACMDNRTMYEPLLVSFYDSYN